MNSLADKLQKEEIEPEPDVTKLLAMKLSDFAELELGDDLWPDVGAP